MDTEKIKRLKRQRDKARASLHNMTVRCELEHWLTMRVGSNVKEDEATIKALTAERDALALRVKELEIRYGLIVESTG
jgi:SMC interacting uncharacterized protein involved in chromosome segregation